jgi:hypothetical protein
MKLYGRSRSRNGSKFTMWYWRGLIFHCGGVAIPRLRASKRARSGSAANVLGGMCFETWLRPLWTA